MEAGYIFIGRSEGFRVEVWYSPRVERYLDDGNRSEP